MQAKNSRTVGMASEGAEINCWKSLLVESRKACVFDGFIWGSWQKVVAYRVAALSDQAVGICRGVSLEPPVTTELSNRGGGMHPKPKA